MPTPKPPYPAQFRQQIVELVQAGRKPSELAKEFGCHVTTILSWVRHAGQGRGRHRMWNLKHVNGWGVRLRS